MARLKSEGIDAIASPDGAWIAVTQPDRIALHRAATLECVATAALPLPGPTDVGFVTGPLRLLIFTRGADVTVGQGFTLPNLEPCGRRDFQGLWHARAFVGDRCLLSGPDSSHQVAVLAPRVLATDSIPLRQTLRFAAAAPESRFLIDGQKQLELWDAPTRRSVFRLSLQLPQAVLQGGFGHHGRLLWIADPRGRLDIYRFSDGRRQLQLDLGPDLLALDGTPDASRLIIARRAPDSPTLELKLLDLARRDLQPLALPPEMERVVAFCLVESEDAVALAGEDGALHLVPLPKPRDPAGIGTGAGSGSGPGDTGSRPLPGEVNASSARDAMTAPRRGAQTGGVSERVNAWRARLRGVDGPPANASPGEAEGEDRTDPAPAVDAEKAPVAPLDASPQDGTTALSRALGQRGPSRADRWRDLVPGRRAGKPPAPAAPEASLELTPTEVISEPFAAVPEPPPAPPRPEPPSPRPPKKPTAPRQTAQDPGKTLAAEGASAWRAALVRWGEALLQAPETALAPPPLQGTPIGVAAQHLELGQVATTLLALLYAAWLLGGDAEGLPAPLLAGIIGDGADWREALGRGELGSAGLVERRRGNLRLHAAAARLLDGQLPRCPMENEAHGVPPERLEGLHLLSADEGATAESLGQELSRQLGRRVALLDLRSAEAKQAKHLLKVGLIEARMYGAVPLILDAPGWQALGARLETLVSLPGVLMVAGPLPPAFDRLPVLALPTALG